jgi:putative CocE/NonD family hydrolase
MTRIRTAFPREVRVVPHAWIPLADGTRLSARLWMPRDADHDPVPAVLEYLPYRKNDATAIDDSVRHPWLAGHGYAAIRVDIRGSGDSEGVLLDEYHPQEQLDCLDVLRWIAAQPWCTGSVGMMGISWGGFNSLQVATHRPPELKAIITCCSTDDRYADDVHYTGGSPLGFYMLPWGTVLLAYNSRPPDPEHIGDGWREMWRERLEKSVFSCETWMRHQRRDDYWRQGSVCEDYSAIEAAVYAVGGWSDGYTDAVLRLLAGLDCPRKGLIGPWEHTWPEEGVPGPAIGFLQESLRWWDHWLKGTETGVMDEPMLRYWRQEPARPEGIYEIRPGAWASEGTWPSPRLEARRLHLTPSGLSPTPGSGERLAHASATTVGLDAGSWLPYGNPADLPGDQRCEDARSLVFDSPPLDDELDLLGNSVVSLRIAADKPVAFVAVRLCDVHPNGTSALITRAILNLCHRNGHADAAPLEPGRDYDVRVPLKAIGQTVPAGHRLRLAISTSYWPWIWPSPEPVEIAVSCSEASLVDLTVRPPGAGIDGDFVFDEPELCERLGFEWLAPREPRWSVSRDMTTNRHTFEMSRALWGSRRLANGIEIRDRDPIRFTVVEGEPLSATVECERTMTIGRGGWQTRIDVRSRMTADAEAFHLVAELEVHEGDEPFFARTYEARISRDHC